MPLNRARPDGFRVASKKLRVPPGEELRVMRHLAIGLGVAAVVLGCQP